MNKLHSKVHIALRRCQQFNYRYHKLNSFSSLGNPMFPSRPLPELPTEVINGTQNNTDFLSKHGSKVAVIALSAAIYLFYSFYKGGQLRNEEEENILKESFIEPNEINELRSNSKINPNDFNNFINESKRVFPNGFASYSQFISFTKSYFKQPVASGHLLDRMVYTHIFKQNKEKNVNGTTEMSPATTTLPIHFLLNLILMTLSENSYNRADVLFDICMISKDNNNSTVEVNSLYDKGMIVSNTDVQDICPFESVETILFDLSETCQIPAEKQVIETGVKYPFRTYRKKLPSDMIAIYKSKSESKFKEEGLSRDEFRELILGSQVCAWGECYRSRS